jgi:hypothetical protein
MALGILPISHNFGLVGISLLSHYRGDGVILLPGFDLQDTLQAIQDYRIGRLNMVNKYGDKMKEITSVDSRVNRFPP